MKEFAKGFRGDAPAIRRVEQREERIVIEVREDALVAQVEVTVLDLEANVLQTGQATKCTGNCWEFAAQSLGRTILIQTWDVAGHVTKLIL